MGPDSLDFWRLHDELSVIEAAILTAGGDPTKAMSEYRSDKGQYEWNSNDDYFSFKEWCDRFIKNFDVVFLKISRAIIANKMPASIVFPLYNGRQGDKFVAMLRGGSARLFQAKGLDLRSYDGLVLLSAEPDWERTTIQRDDLKATLSECGFTKGFFFPENEREWWEDEPTSRLEGFRDKNHPRYAPKLAACVAAWEAVDAADKNKSVKATLGEWLQSNAAAFGVGDKSGVVSSSMANGLAEIVNWATDGGAPKTYREVSGTEGEVRAALSDNYEEVEFSSDKNGIIDEGVPF